MSKPIQQQVARLVWHANYSLKRSISAVTNAAANAMPSPNPNYSGHGSLNKNWIHPPDALIYGRVEYTVKFLGDVAVDEAKGTNVIKSAIEKLRFNLSVKKSTGFKLQKVELHINVDGVNIVDAKTKMVLHKYPLHRISFCADDKTDKRLFAFIARQHGVGHGGVEHQKHHCYVFLSDKLAEEITLTIGEAFDLAYRRFLDNNGRDLELKKQMIVLRKRVSDLESENADLKRQLAQQQRNISSAAANSTQHHTSSSNSALIDVLTSKSPANQAAVNATSRKWENFSEYDLDPLKSTPPPLPTSPMPHGPPPAAAAAAAATTAVVQPPPTLPKKSTQRVGGGPSSNVDIMQMLASNGPEVGRRLENLRLAELEDIFDQDFDPRAGENQRKNPFESERGAKATNGNGNKSSDVGGVQNPMSEPSSEDFEMAISMIDSRLADMRDGFTTGLSFGQDDFTLGELDPNAAGIVDATRKTS